MKQVPLSVLENKIIRPGFEEHLLPLIMYRGAVTLGRAHRMWNLVVSGMEHEATIADMTQRLQHSPAFSQLCGPEKRKEAVSLYSFLTRLEANPKVMAEMPGLAEYVDWLGGFRWTLTPISEITHRSRHTGAGGWRTFVDRRTRAYRGDRRKPKIKVERSPLLVYPFLIHDGGRPEHTLLRQVNAAIPRAFAPDLRADMCQDLLIGILSGDFNPDDLGLPAKEIARRVLKMSNRKYGALSLDQEMGDDGFSLMDTLADEGRDWA